MGGYIYLICDPVTETYKIWVTRNLNSNIIKKIQTGNSSELHIINKYKCNYPFRLEKMLHGIFANKRILNEWFKLEYNDVINFENICEKTNNIILSLMDNPFFVKNIK